MKRYDEKFHDISNYSRNLFDETDQYVPTNDKQITKGVIKTCFNKKSYENSADYGKDLLKEVQYLLKNY